MWVTGYMGAIDADFRRYYSWPPDMGPGVADGVFPEGLCSGRFFTLCEEMKFQGGSAIQGHAEAEQAEREEQGTPAPAPVSGGGARRVSPSSEGRVQEVPSEAAHMHAGFAGDGREFPPVFRVRTPRKRSTEG